MPKLQFSKDAANLVRNQLAEINIHLSAAQRLAFRSNFSTIHRFITLAQKAAPHGAAKA